MRARILLALLICTIVLAGGIGYYSLVPREGPVQPTSATQSTIAPPPEKTVGLNITMISNAVPAAFPTIMNMTSLVENTNSRGIDSLGILQTMPEGFNLTGVYLAKADGSRSPYNPTVTPDGLSYPLNSTLAPKEEIAIIVLLQSTPVAVSGKFTTIARGTCDGKWVWSQGVASIYVKPPATTCSDWGTIAFGEFLLENNIWGGPYEPHSQCMTVGPGRFGWNLSRLSPSSDEQCHCIQPYYPEVIYGKKPWQVRSTTSSLPMPVGSIEVLEVSLAVGINPYAKYNLAFDIWITNRTNSDPGDITDEFMIWLVWTPGLAGENVLDTLNDGHNIYQHRAYEHWDMIQTQGSLKWRYHQFTITKQGIPSRINILAFLDHLRKEKHDLRYLASIELGNEVWSGAGATAVTKFGIDLKTTQNLKSSTVQYEANYLERGWRVIANKRSPDIIDTETIVKTL